MIQEHIHKLLFDHDCVIIPDFGGLITHYDPARIHPVKHAFTPPSKRVAFNEKLKLNDGLLISTFAYDSHLSAEDAQIQVAEFVRSLQEELRTSQRFELRGVGLFRLNAEQKIEFEYIPSDNFLTESFGLPELMSKPVLAADAAAGLRTLLKEKQTAGQVSTAKPTLRRKVQRIYDRVAVMAIAGLSISALYFISLQADYNLSSLNPLALIQPAPENTGTPENAGTQTEPYVALEETLFETPQPLEESVNRVLAMDEALPADTKPAAAPAAATVIAKTPAAPAVAPSAIKKAIKKEMPAAPALAKAPGKIRVKAAWPAKKAPVTTINSGTGRYYIIAGGFSDLQNAKRTLDNLKIPGNQGKVILPPAEGQLHRVSITDFASREEALNQLPALRQKFGNNIWILNY